MRSNGLTASSYQPVADLQPTVAEGMLDDLRDEGIAAYCQPLESSTVAGFDRPEFRVEVLVRLYVDSGAVERALELLSGRDPEVLSENADNEDLAWAQIVAGFDVPASTQVAPWPVYEDVTPGDDADDPPARVAPLVRDDPWASRDLEDVDRFVPPDPPPLPHLSMAERLSWLGLLGGPIVLVLAAIVTYALPGWLMLIAALAFIAGFVSLVARLDRTKDRLDDPDDGAQV